MKNLKIRKVVFSWIKNGKDLIDFQNMNQLDVVFEALKGLVPAKKPELYDLNKKAIEAGANL